MDRDVAARRWLPVAVVVAALVLLTAGAVVVCAGRALKDMAQPYCAKVASEAQLDQIAGDPMLTTDVPGTEVTARRSDNPCDPGEESRAAVTVERALTAGTTWTDVRARYETLLTEHGWTVATGGAVLCATRPLDGRLVVFDLRQGNPPADKQATIRFWPSKRDASC